jgi:hemin uptake protein HemP
VRQSDETSAPRSSEHAKPCSPDLPRVVNSQELFAGQRVLVEHAGQHYRLLITRNDRLILLK